MLNATAKNRVLGLELDPEFTSNNKVYICYTYGSAGKEHDRVSRFTLSGSGLIAEKSRLEMRCRAHHNGCRVAFGPYGKLYISIGDNDPSGTDTQDLGVLAGKIFRINPDGSIPSDNPFYITQSGSSRAIWSFSHRNWPSSRAPVLYDPPSTAPSPATS